MDSYLVSKYEYLWLAGRLWGIFGKDSNVPAVIDYIKNQREHHEKETFEQEYERLMKYHEVNYDPKYLFD